MVKSQQKPRRGDIIVGSIGNKVIKALKGRHYCRIDW